ncbi:MAG TPA: putative toxin-antitoxin system toxin component, PIN family [Candidatus Woesebacteria bacterium]|nr:putative toxin-antitoxin system toxin component, PIN family [Candidatus Woesebacteria bacterium]
MIIILDTSVLITLLLAKGKNGAQDIVSLAKLKKLILAISIDTLEELKTVVQKNRFKKDINYSLHKVSTFVAWYQYNSKKIKVNNNYHSPTLRDPKDNMFLQLAIASEATYLISLDKDLLTLGFINKTIIVTPRQFLEAEFNI